MSKLKPLPKLPRGDSPLVEAKAEAERKARVNVESLVPIPSADPADPTQVRFKCAACGKLHPWRTHMWGGWDTGEQMAVMVKRATGRWVRFFVPVRMRGRVGATCVGMLTNWKRTAEPAVTVNEDRRHREMVDKRKDQNGGGKFSKKHGQKDEPEEDDNGELL